MAHRIGERKLSRSSTARENVLLRRDAQAPFGRASIISAPLPLMETSASASKDIGMRNLHLDNGGSHTVANITHCYACSSLTAVIVHA